MEGVEDVIDARDGMSILNGGGVELMEIHAEPQPAIFLFHHHNGGSPWAEAHGLFEGQITPVTSIC